VKEISRSKFPDLRRQDEVGSLANAFRVMVTSLREQTRRTLEVIDVLGSAASDISATVAQLASITSRTSSSVAETSTTVEQVRQVAELARDKAKLVAEISQEAVNSSDRGKRSVESTIEKMDMIKVHTGQLAKSLFRLNEHSLSIEKIIEAVKDIADQSNLLAVNASIEAARAGDQGKGFTVVAHEIQSMAAESKEATQQVKSTYRRSSQVGKCHHNGS